MITDTSQRLLPASIVSTSRPSRSRKASRATASRSSVGVAAVTSARAARVRDSRAAKPSGDRSGSSWSWPAIPAYVASGRVRGRRTPRRTDHTGRQRDGSRASTLAAARSRDEMARHAGGGPFVSDYRRQRAGCWNASRWGRGRSARGPGGGGPDHSGVRRFGVALARGRARRSRSSGLRSLLALGCLDDRCRTAGGCCSLSARRICVTHSGMFPCFLAGRISRLDFSSRSARTISIRVSWGEITASM